MLLRAARPQSLLLLDFLAPSLIARSYNAPSTTPTEGSKLVQPSKYAPREDLRAQIFRIHSPNAVPLSNKQQDAFNSTLARIHQAVFDKNGQALIGYWQHLEKHKMLHLLKEPQLKVITSRVLEVFPPPKGVEPWDPHRRKVLEDIALAGAVAGTTTALEACMFAHIKRGDPGSAISLYGRFMEMLGPEEEVLSDDLEIDEEQLMEMNLFTIPPPDSMPQSPHHPGRMTILLLVTTAHAMKDDFQAALQTGLKTTIRFRRDFTDRFLKHNLSYDRPLKAKVVKFVDRIEIGCLVARPPALSKHITQLAQSNALTRLQTLYRGIVDELLHPKPCIAADPSGVTPSQSLALTQIGWSALLVGFLKLDQQNLADAVWEDMLRFSVTPSIIIWTAVIDAYGEKRMGQAALGAWSMMKAQGIRPEALTYRALISALFNAKQPGEALRMLQLFRQDLMETCSPEDSLQVYNTALRGLLWEEQRVDEATTLLGTMSATGPKPDVVSYNTFLTYHGRRGDLRALARTITEMALVGVVGDVFSFSTILSSLLKVGREDAPEMMFSLMRKQGIEPNVVLYTAIIDNQMKEKKEENMQAAFRMLQRMESDPQISPNDVTYTAILTGLYRGWLPRRKANELKEDILGRMAARGVKLNQATYHLLLKACLTNPSPEGLQDGLAYYREMQREKVPLRHATWYILLAGLLHRHEWDYANEIVKDMFMSGTQPTGRLMELVSRIRKRTALRVPYNLHWHQPRAT